MSSVMLVPSALGAFVIALLIFGFLPGLVLALIVRLFPKDDPRRRELQAELYAVPRWERPFWVCQQFEVALRLGLAPEIAWYWGRFVWHRAKVESGREMHKKYPDSFWVPDAEEKAMLRPGDLVKLMWEVKRSPGERMWVKILHRDGDVLIGRLLNWPVYVHLDPDAIVRFRIDDIIDYELADEGDGPEAIAA